MKGWIKFILTTLLAITLAGCWLEPNDYQHACKVFPMHKPYSGVVADGPFEIHLTPAPVGAPITVIGPEHAVERTDIRVLQNTVYVVPAWNHFMPPGRVKVYIPVGGLKVFSANLKFTSILQDYHVVIPTFYVKTEDVSHAEVQASNLLSIWAMENSSVFYFGKQPRLVHIKRNCDAIVQYIPQRP